MREIKFRAWDSKNKKMWFPASFKSGVGCDVPNEYLKHTETDIFLCCRSNGVIFMQFTGLHDKNGKEIYKGDIVLLTNPDEQIQKCKLICSVIFSWASFGVQVERVEQWEGYNVKHPDVGSILWFLNITECKIIEVIGNEFEHPELLKEAKGC